MRPPSLLVFSKIILFIFEITLNHEALVLTFCLACFLLFIFPYPTFHALFLITPWQIIIIYKVTYFICLNFEILTPIQSIHLKFRHLKAMHLLSHALVLAFIKEMCKMLLSYFAFTQGLQ